MKYLLAFALVAVASALPQPVHLLGPVQISQPNIAPLMVPQEVMDEIALLVKFVDAPEAMAVRIVDAPETAEAPEPMAVRIVDAPETAEAPETTAVHFVDTPIETNDTPAQIKIADTPLPESVVLPFAELVNDVVKIVDLPEEASNDFAVKFVDVAEETPSEQVASANTLKIVDLPEISSADLAVKFVDVADVDEESPSYMPIKLYAEPQPIHLPGKQYSNPMWR